MAGHGRTEQKDNEKKKVTVIDATEVVTKVSEVVTETILPVCFFSLIDGNFYMFKCKAYRNQFKLIHAGL